MDREIQQRLLWVKLYETSGDAGLYAAVVVFLVLHRT